MILYTLRLLLESIAITALLLWALISTCLAGTNTYHAAFAWDRVTNATGYAIIVRSNGNQIARVPSSTNYTTVSNLSFALDNYHFSCVATNAAGDSDESNVAPLHWMTVNESDSISGPWVLLATNSFAAVEPQHFIALSNWSAASLLKKD